MHPLHPDCTRCTPEHGAKRVDSAPAAPSPLIEGAQGANDAREPNPRALRNLGRWEGSQNVHVLAAGRGYFRPLASRAREARHG